MAKRARGPRPNRTRPIHLITRYALCAALLFAGQATSAAEARLLSRFHWETDNPELGGFSALEVGEDGLALTVLMDRGRLVQGRLLRTSAGIEGVSATAETNLLGLDGQPLSEDDDDSEGLVLDGLGGFSVSFEGPARVWHYASPDAVPTEIKLSREFAQMQNNASLESLAAADGALLTMPERSSRFDKDFPIYRFDGTRWSVLRELSRDGPFLITGADVGPDGYLYILERDFVGVGFRSRIRRMDLADGATETLMVSAPWEYDNLEGISAWRDGEGRLRLTTVSDNNFLAIQKTEFVEFVVTD
jgi:hypothetical protein